MHKWNASYEDRPAEQRAVESRSALDAAKDFALLCPRGDDCTVVVAPHGEHGLPEMFRRTAGVFSPYLPPPPPAPPETYAPPALPDYAASKDTYSYRGWLVSDSFMKRCMAVCGYGFVGHALIAVLVWALVLGTLIGCGLAFRGMFGGLSNY